MLFLDADIILFLFIDAADPGHSTKDRVDCNVCGKSFASKHNMLRHKMLHTGNRPFSCDICGRSFTQRVHAQSHFYTVHMKDQF